jgi:Bacterial regulatory helix-turn-helix protein, lysR family
MFRGRIVSIRKIDLNLFRVFEAIMRHRSLSGASREPGVTPFAVSHALARLRQALDDVTVEVIWHERSDRDGGAQWFRREMIEAMQAMRHAEPPRSQT